MLSHELFQLEIQAQNHYLVWIFKITLTNFINTLKSIGDNCHSIFLANIFAPEPCNLRTPGGGGHYSQGIGGRLGSF